VLGVDQERLTDVVAYLSRRMARTKARKLSEMLFRYYPGKQGKTIIHDFDGDLSIQLDRGSYISSAIYWAGHHSRPLIEFLRKFLRPEMTVTDVGANIGEVSLFMAKKLTKGSVLAFEPMPDCFAELSANVALNKFSAAQVRLFNFGLCDVDELRPLYGKKDQPYRTNNDGVSSLYHGEEDRRLGSAVVRRFDEVAQECGLQRLDLMKIDVEGAEWMVLRGAEESLKRFRPWLVVEISSKNFRRAGYEARELVSYLEGMGYQMRNLETGAADLESECDVLCVPIESARGIREPNLLCDS
jgi:FkbM family methyltransferase